MHPLTSHLTPSLTHLFPLAHSHSRTHSHSFAHSLTAITDSLTHSFTHLPLAYSSTHPGSHHMICGCQFGCSDFRPFRRFSPPLSTPAGVWCRYFAEAPAACHSMCDNCLRQLKVTRQDVSAAAAAVVQTLQALPAADKRLTLTQLVDAWRKSQVHPLSFPHFNPAPNPPPPTASPCCSRFPAPML